jgi:hypothetical protein
MAFMGRETFGTAVRGNEADLDNSASRSGHVHLIGTADG